MKSSRSMNSVAISFALLTCFVMAGMPVATAVPSDVVYGNLGAAGADPLSATNTDFGGGLLSDNVLSLAQGFTTGSSSQGLLLQDITLGMFSSDLPSARTVSIYANIGGVPDTGSSPLFTSAPQNVTSTGKYTFAFSAGLLSPTTSYWIVPQGPASWYFNNDETQGTEQNASGWNYLGTKRITTTSSGTWINSTNPYSVSITAVPEPSTCAMGLVGLACGGWGMWRLRKRA